LAERSVTRVEVIKAIDLVKIYRLGKIEFPALRGVNIIIKQGDFLAIVGPSGSGKSTLMNLFGALDRPTKGSVLIDGVDISTLSADGLAVLRNRKLGFVFQTFNLLTYLNALQNVEVPLIAAGVPSLERINKAKQTLTRVGLEGFEKNRPTELSGGQQQRVAVARALINDPKIILADEPTGNLDTESSRNLIDIFHRLNSESGVTIIMVTHNLELTNYCNRVVMVRDGLIEREINNDV
jgi:putative ABC transport system ATP-binding protein